MMATTKFVSNYDDKKVITITCMSTTFHGIIMPKSFIFDIT